MGASVRSDGDQRVGRSAQSDLVGALDRHGSPFATVVDVENTVLPFGAPTGRARDLMEQASASLHGLSQLRRVIFLSRARFPIEPASDRAASVSTSRARKPWTSKASLRKLAGDDRIVAVFGSTALFCRLGLGLFLRVTTQSGSRLVLMMELGSVAIIAAGAVDATWIWIGAVVFGATRRTWPALAFLAVVRAGPPEGGLAVRPAGSRRPATSASGSRPRSPGA